MSEPLKNLNKKPYLISRSRDTLIPLRLYYCTIIGLLGVAREDLSNEETKMLQQALEAFDKYFFELQALLNDL